MRRKWLIFNEAEPELQPCPRILRSPPSPLAHKLQGKNNQWCGKPIAAVTMTAGPGSLAALTVTAGRTWCYDLGAMGWHVGACCTLFMGWENQIVNASWCLSLGVYREEGVGARILALKSWLLQAAFLDPAAPPLLCLDQMASFWYVLTVPSIPLIMVCASVVTTSWLSSTVDWAHWEWGQCLDLLCKTVLPEWGTCAEKAHRAQLR